MINYTASQIAEITGGVLLCGDSSVIADNV